jgi:Contractile injection system tube protein/LysM domain
MASKAQKAYLETEGKKKIPCMFNPAELAFSISNDWESTVKPGQQVPALQYTGGKSATLNLDLFLDTTHEGKPVTTYVNALVKLMMVDTSLPGYDKKKQNGRPGWVKLHWGRFHSFRCVIDNLEVKYTYFGKDGTPLRATAGVSLVQYNPENAWPNQNPTSGTPTPGQAHVVQRGESLDRLAARYYGDPFRWRPIADMNGIRDPFSLKPGRVLDIPQIEA